MQLRFWVAVRRGVARVSAAWMDLYDFLGYVGKVKFPFRGIISYGCWVALPLLVFGCGGPDAATMLQSGRVVGLVGLEGRWVGPVSPAELGCGGTTTGLMTIGHASFGFAPFENTVVIHGTVGSDETLTGTLERVGGDRQMLAINVEAQVVHVPNAPDRIEGALASGRCRWRMKLTRG